MPTIINSNTNLSLLSEESIAIHIKFAQDKLKEQGCVPVLFVFHLQSGDKLCACYDELPPEADEKRTVLQALGRQVRDRFGGFGEAIFIGEFWTTNSSAPDANKIPPGQHPAREEAIVLVGRNEANSRSMLVTQHFSRNETGEPIWHEVVNHQCDEESGQTFDGFLDYLFEETADSISP